MVGVAERRGTPGDLRAKQHLGATLWARDPALLAFETSPGILAWEGAHDGGRVLERDGTLVGWTRLTPGYRRIRRMGEWDDAPPSLLWSIHPDEPDRAALLAAAVEHAVERSGPDLVTSHPAADRHAAAVLSSLGFEPAPTEPFAAYLARPTAGEAPVASGLRCVSLAETGDLAQRAEVHRQAWDGSTFDVGRLAVVMATWPYRPELDLLAMAADGTLVASLLAWFDPALGVAEIEPLGVVPEARGTGVGAFLLHAACQRLRAAGAEHVLVGARADDDYPAPRRLYGTAGFREVARQVVVARPRTGA